MSKQEVDIQNITPEIELTMQNQQRKNELRELKEWENERLHLQNLVKGNAFPRMVDVSTIDTARKISLESPLNGSYTVTRGGVSEVIYPPQSKKA